MTPRGIPQPNGTIKISVALPAALFKRLVERAWSTKSTFSSVIADAAECGLLDIEESEAFEPARLENKC